MTADPTPTLDEAVQRGLQRLAGGVCAGDQGEIDLARAMLRAADPDWTEEMLDNLVTHITWTKALIDELTALPDWEATMGKLARVFSEVHVTIRLNDGTETRHTVPPEGTADLTLGPTLSDAGQAHA